MDTKALNEKLLKFAGFNHYMGSKSWSYPYGYYSTQKPPNIVDSLDLQSKYLYPKLLNYRITKDYSPRKNLWKIEIYTANNEGCAENLNESLAFALAVEKLIDNLEKK